MTAHIDSLLRRVQILRGHQTKTASMLKEAEADLDASASRVQATEEAQMFLMQIAQQTQENLNERLSSLVTSALEAVFPDPYSFRVEYVQRRNTTECDLYFITPDGHKLEPLDTVGGGVVDIAAFALRVAVWSLSDTAPVLILDEPFRNLHVSLHAKAGAMLQELSKKMGLQIIMVSHNPEIIAGADRLFVVDNGHVAARE